MNPLQKAVIGAALCCLPTISYAAASFSGIILNNDQTVGPLDDVTFSVRLTNTGDEPATVDWVFASAPTDITGYSPSFSATQAGFPSDGLFAPGASLDFDFVTYLLDSPPAAPGLYVGGTVFEMGIDVTPNASDEFSTTVEFGTPSWTVVPEPATLALFGLGLAGIPFVRRRRTLA